MRVVAVALLLVLAACGGGGSEPKNSSSGTPSSSTNTETGTTPSPQPTTATPTGKPAPEALSGFRCEQDAKGAWNASGLLSNSGKAKVTYQVTVYIGQATGGEERAKTKQIPSVAGGGSVKFAINKIPAPQDGGPCHVQVLTSK